MCGIAGLFDPFRALDLSRLEGVSRALDTLAHRGPDAMNIVRTQGLILGHRKLSILDHSPASDQPFLHRHLTVAFNGEIFNFEELAAELRCDLRNVRWDGEVLARALAQWGDDAWERFDGEFAVAAYDRNRRQLTLVRDRAGAKPMFLCRQGRTTAFASEIKALRHLLPLSLRPNLNRAFEDLLLGPWAPREATWFEQIEPLAPGSVLSIDSNGETLRRYWAPKAIGSHQPEALAQAIRTSVALRLCGPQPAALLVSGGIDSSVVATIASQQAHVVAYSASYGDRTRDEVKAAASLCAGLGIELREVFVANDAISVERCGDLCLALEEPPTDLVFYAAWALYSAACQDGVRVALTGQGNDELWGGYDLEHPIAATLGHTFQLEPMAARLRGLLDGNGVATFSGGTVVRKSLWSGPWIEHAFHQGLDIQLLRGLRSENIAERALPFLFRTALGRHLDQEDRLSMAHSIESRSPLISNALIARSLARPSASELAMNEKGEFRAAACRIIGSSATRPKRSFPQPPATAAASLIAYAQDEVKSRHSNPLLGPLINSRLSDEEIHAILSSAPGVAVRVASLARFSKAWGLN